eukprot:TRINITY_DN37_c0_g1_i5.p1 TRINITY_DN37_c0_g1~~TRINITY_DN37_c0_g1_i5.p1  ORF type:complete len:327 (-),score=112.46 TRINITY_DN37_c0_g1_i5:104-1060(-)
MMADAAAAAVVAVGVVRNRSSEYLRFRADHRAHSFGAGGGGDGEGGTELKLVGANQHLLDAGHDHVINVPPEWLSYNDEIQTDFKMINDMMRKLKGVHQTHIMVIVGEEASSQQHEIEILTSQITQELSKVHRKVKILGTRTPRDAGSDQLKTLKNAQMAAAQQLQGLSQEFKQQQQSYLTQIRNRSSKFKDNFTEEQSGDFVDYEDKGFTAEQMATMESNQQDAAQRYREIRHIVKSIMELSDIVKDLAMLVVDQGTVLDRIDHNIDTTLENTERAVAELEEASKIQSKTRTKMCCLLLIILIFVMVVLLILRLFIR